MGSKHDRAVEVMDEGVKRAMAKTWDDKGAAGRLPKGGQAQ